jgi:AraC-like DNA-binding protein
MWRSVTRLLALSLVWEAGCADQIRRRFARAGSAWGPSLDALVDYIRANVHLTLTLTDLEEHSHDSARHLQTLFRQTFDCTPMQFVRRQRLAAAMEALQTAQPGDTVTRIARACGYRFLPNFTHDFQSRFGVNPSTVLRRCRQPSG